MNKWFKIGMLCLSALASVQANATIIGSVPTEFGVPTFGGSNIPNDSISYDITQATQSFEFLIGMAITPRFQSPAVTHDGSGNYFAAPGESDGTPATSPIGAKWNFSVYISSIFRNPDGSTGGIPLMLTGLNSLELLYDVNPGSGVADYGSINLFATLFDSTGFPDLSTSTIQFSQNLAFDFLYSDVPGFLSAPSGSFDLNDLGEYNFRLSAGFTDGQSSSVSVNAQVGATPVPAPAPLALVLLPLAGLLGFRLRTNR